MPVLFFVMLGYRLIQARRKKSGNLSGSVRKGLSIARAIGQKLESMWIGTPKRGQTFFLKPEYYNYLVSGVQDALGSTVRTEEITELLGTMRVYPFSGSIHDIKRLRRTR